MLSILWANGFMQTVLRGRQLQLGGRQECNALLFKNLARQRAYHGKPVDMNEGLFGAGLAPGVACRDALRDNRELIRRDEMK